MRDSDPGGGVLVVCTANICRSPTTALMLERALGRVEAAGLRVESAGVMAIDGMRWCPQSMGLAGFDPEGPGRSRELTREVLCGAGLVLAATREHRQAVAQMDPSLRGRSFTILQAARLARWVLETAERPEDELDPSPGARLAWLVDQLDGARGMGGALPGPPEAPRAPTRWWAGRRARVEPRPAEGAHPDDLGDPHLPGGPTHDQAVGVLAAAVTPIAAVLDVALG